VIEIPAEVAGRPVTRRGVHLLPFGYHGGWCREAGEWPRSYWLDLMKAMGLSWVVLLTDGDSVLEPFDGKSPLEWLLGAGVVPVVRYYGQLPYPFAGHDAVRRAVPIYAEHGLRPFWQLWNEPGNDREWAGGDAPEDWWERFVPLWNQAARDVEALGGWPGFPDGPDYDYDRRHPFRDAEWTENRWFGSHPYGLGRPIEFPLDDVSRFGVPLVEGAYREALDDFWLVRDWMDVWVEGDEALTVELSLALVNERRAAWADPDPPARYTACWNSWRVTDAAAREALDGWVPSLIVTEGGWTPRDRAGTGDRIDYRWPYTTPRMVAHKTLEVFEDPASPFLGICPWLLACEDMGGSGWPFEAWHGWAYSDLYGRRKPVIEALVAEPPGGARAKVAAAADATESAAGRLGRALELLG